MWGRMARPASFCCFGGAAGSTTLDATMLFALPNHEAARRGDSRVYYSCTCSTQRNHVTFLFILPLTILLSSFKWCGFALPALSSPCGTGTCAVMATLWARGELSLGQPFVHEGILGTTFTGVLVEETSIAPPGVYTVRRLWGRGVRLGSVGGM